MRFRGSTNPGALPQATLNSAFGAKHRQDGFAWRTSVQKVLGSRLRCGALALDALPKGSTTKVPLA